MGKSTAAEILRQRGFPVVASDELARQLVQPGQPALAAIQELFGRDIVESDGALDRRKLAKRVFGDAKLRQQLEGILHPRIREVWEAQVPIWRAQGYPAAVNDIPLLFETQAEGRFDVTICVACSASTQCQRLRQRGWTDQDIERRIQAQWPMKQKITKAQYVVWTESSLEVHQEQWERILKSEDLWFPTETLHNHDIKQG